MAGRADIEAGKAFIRLFLKDDMTKALQKSLASVGKSLQSTGAMVAKIGAGVSAGGAAILAPLAAAVSHFMNVGDDLSDMSARTKIAAGVLAELGYAATQSGTDLGVVEKNILKMTKTLGDAVTGSKSAQAAFSALGLDISKLIGMKPDEQFQAVADALVAIEDPAERMSRASDIFGKAAAEILPMIENLRTLREEARKEGLIPTEEAVAAGAKLKDEFSKLIAVASSLAFEIGASLVDEVRAFFDIAREAIKTVREWIKENKGLVKIVAAVGVALIVAGGIITAVGGMLVAAGLAVSGFATLLAAVGPILAFLVSPIGLIVLGIAAITAALTAGIVWWAKFTDSGKAAVRIVKESFGGIFAALAAGKWQLAGEIAITALKLAWVKGTVELEQIWADIVHGIKSLWYDAMTKIADAFFAVIDDVKAAWNDAFGDTMPIGGGDSSGARDALGEDAARAKTGRDDAKAKDDAARVKRIEDAKKSLQDLIDKARALDVAGVPGGGGGGLAGGGGRAAESPADRLARLKSEFTIKQMPHVITVSGAAAVAAGYQGGMYNPNRKEKEIEKAVIKHLEAAEKRNEKMLRAVERIAEGLVH